MPRNGDGSSDNGPIEGHEIVHGVSGNDSLQHTKHVAPMPEVEAGDSLPGMGAGGVADVTQGDSEAFRTNEPKKDNLADDKANANSNTTSASRDSSSRPSAPKRQKTGSIDDSASQGISSSSSASKSGANNGHSSASSHAQSNTAHEASSDLDQIARHKAEKYVNLDNDEVKLSAASTEHDKREARAERRADALGESASSKGDAQKGRYGDRADVESLHGATDTSKSGGEKTGQGNNESRYENTDGAQGKGGKGRLDEGNDLEKVQRHQAEKFGAVNLQNE